MKNYFRVFAKRLFLLCADLFLVLLTLPLALFLRLEGDALSQYFHTLFPFYYVTAFTCYLISFLVFKPYRTILRLANLFTALRVASTICIGGLLFFAATNFFQLQPIPRSVYFIQILLLVPSCLGVRFSFRIFDRFTRKSNHQGTPTLIYGAGLTTDRILPMLLRASPQFKIVGIVDDDAAKHGSEVQGIRVLGGGKDIERISQRYGVTHILLSMPSLSGDTIGQIAKQLYPLRLTVKVLPSPETYISDADTTNFSIRDLNIEDLLRRSPRKLDKSAIETLVQNKIVLVTGAGGSIGSELARQIAGFTPRHLILNDASEYSLYSIVEELSEQFPNLTITPALANLTDKNMSQAIFQNHAIEIVFHACAYKHVPMLEANIVSGIKNNIISADHVFNFSQKSGVKKVVLISSDKAVRPPNVMGATKRICELLALWYAANFQNSTAFTCVRFGNVLGSSGSVVPKFLDQIKAGGPITITHPDITRYFMLIPEAVSLVLQAATASENFATYLLNMGEPIKIVDMAKDLLQLMGKQPDIDINIIFTGLRPGEKLFEELHLDSEELTPITEDFSKIANSTRLSEDFRKKIDALLVLCEDNQGELARKKLFEIVNFYEKPEKNFTKQTSNIDDPIEVTQKDIDVLTSQNKERSSNSDSVTGLSPQNV